MTHVLILGQSRSGSSLLMRLLNFHPDVHIYGENWNALHHLYMFHRSIKDIEDWKPDYQKALDGEVKPAWMNNMSEDSVKTNLHGVIQTMFPDWPKHGVRGFKEIRVGLPHYNPTYKEFEQEIDWYNEIFPNMKVIFLTRNMKDMLMSAWHPKDPTSIELQLNHQQKFYRRYASEHPHRCLELKYKFMLDITKGPRAIFEWLGLEYRETMSRALDIKL